MAGDRMLWSRLLDDTRLRKALDGKESVKAEGEARSPFERDRDRTISSSPVRRLIGKTQVFPLDPNDHVRTRLVHSLEVSTVAEGLASQVVQKVILKHEHLDERQQRAVSKIAETCGLLHDLGNPPFGHAGELAIATWFQEKLKSDTDLFKRLGGADSQKAMDFLQFEGNAQTMRILTNTRLLGHDRGLNLTVATTAASRKYLASSLQVNKKGNHAFAKPGYFFSETEIVGLVADRTGTSGRRHPITFLVEAADDIVYSVVDIEDGIKKRILTWRQVQDFLEARCKDSKLMTRVMDLVRQQLTSVANARDSELGQSFRINAISELVLAAVTAFGHRYDAIMSGEYEEELVQDVGYEGRSFIESCKGLLRETVFRNEDVLRLEVRGRKVLHDLMDLFWEAVSDYLRQRKVTTKTYAGKLYFLIADSHRNLFQQRIEDDPDNGVYLGLQLVTDYVSGMTDGFACRLHEELVNG